MHLRIAKKQKAATIPKNAYAGDAGFDLVSVETTRILPGETKKINTGLVCEIPAGYGGFILPRSGLSVKHSLTIPNSPGLIDSGYRGEIIVALRNDSGQEYVVEEYDRIAQMVIMKVEQINFIEVSEEEISETDRGKGGFGSSGNS
jgi:dUTP pyrophosphatase